MRCREARHRIEAGDFQNPELIRHLESCPACARLMSAQRRLDSALAETRERSAADTEAVPPLDFVRTRVEALTAERNRKENTIMSIIKSHRRAAVSIGAVIVLLIVFTLVPFTYKKPVGYEVVIPVDNEAMAAVNLTQLTHALNLLGYDEANVNYSSTSDKKKDKTYMVTDGEFAAGDSTLFGEFKISGLPDKDAARKAGVLFVTLSGGGTELQHQVEVVLKMRDVTGSLYAALKEKLTIGEEAEIWVDSDDKSDEQISAEILEQLAMRGFHVADVTTATNSDGEREVHIHLGKNVTLDSADEHDSAGESE